MAEAAAPAPSGLVRKSDATDLALTLPIFLGYHLAVVFLPMRNAADPVTTELSALAEQSLVSYACLTLAIGVALVAALLVFGQRKALSAQRFGMIAAEGAAYAVIMRLAAAAAVGSLPLAGGPAPTTGAFSSVVMALGAGFYEEIAFRVGLFGIGRLVLAKTLGTGHRGILALAAWAVLEAAVFSGWHYVGAFGDGFELRSFVFRAVCGLMLTTVYALRGFAPAVWTHALYDVWVMI